MTGCVEASWTKTTEGSGALLKSRQWKQGGILVGMNPTAEALRLTPAEQVALAGVVRSTRAPAGLVKRAQIVLAIVAGESYTSISARLHVPASTISRWRKRYTELRFAGLQDAQRSGRPKQITPQIEVKIIATTKKAPPSPYTHWSASRLARRVGVKPLDRAAHLEEGAPEAASPRALQGESRSRVRGESRYDHRTVPEPASARRRILRGREDRNPGAGEDRSRAPALTRARGAPRVRVSPPRYALVVRGSGGFYRPRARQDRPAAHE